ncbi:MAG: NACHT domain-containing protein (plasmid) [Phormidium sp.]
MSEAPDPKKVSNHDLRGSQFAGGIVDATNVYANQIGGDIYNNNIFLGQQFAKGNNLVRSRKEQFLLEEMKQMVSDRLKKSLLYTEPINLVKELQPQQVKQLWNTEVKIGEKPPFLLPSNTNVIEIFDLEEIAGRLLILGAPGAGKTTTLLELAETLISRAEADPNYPIPWVCNLSSWRDDRQTIADWLVTTIELQFKPLKGLIGEWLKNQRIIPLLDGLDELQSTRQELCVQAINELMKGEYRPKHLVVCSRLGEYENYDTRLELSNSISLKSLTNSQLQEYLANISHTYFWQSISNNSNLLPLVRNPLLLNVSILAYEEISFEQWQKLTSVEDRIQYLLDSYVGRMLSRDIDSKAYIKQKFPSSHQTRLWLIWLAQQLQRESQTEFLIEKMQPNWLKPTDLRIYNIILLIIIILIFSLTTVLPTITQQLSFSDIIGLVIGSIVASFPFKYLYKQITPIETFKFPQVKLYKLFLGYGVSVLILSLAFGVNTQLIPRLIFGCIFSLVLLGNLAFTSERLEIKQRKAPNQDIFYSTRITLIFILISCLGFGLTIILTDKIAFSTLITGATVVPTIALLTGGMACLQHFLLRFLLWRNGYIPWNYARFLHYAEERLFIIKIGGRYQFFHKLLQDHFANMKSEKF